MNTFYWLGIQQKQITATVREMTDIVNMTVFVILVGLSLMPFSFTIGYILEVR